ncbi:MAG: hypothetical protein RIE53_14100 [Rhodothermales bacterium]
MQPLPHMLQHVHRPLILHVLLLCTAGTLCAQSAPRPADYLALQEGNVWEYTVDHQADGKRLSPTALRFSVSDRLPAPDGFTDYRVHVDIYDDGVALRRTTCRLRTDGNDPFFVGTNPLNRVDCAFQSPFLAADVEQETGTTSVVISDSVFPAPYIGVYENYWSNQNGESGNVTSLFAPGLGLYRYESRRTPAILDLSAKRTTWTGELVYALIDGVSYGSSRQDQHPGVRDDGAPY